MKGVLMAKFWAAELFQDLADHGLIEPKLKEKLNFQITFDVYWPEGTFVQQYDLPQNTFHDGDTLVIRHHMKD